MIKKVFVIVSILLLTVSCSLFNKEGEEKILDTDKILFEAMESKREISLENATVLFKDINVTEEETTNIDKYVYVDFDNDEINELVALDKSTYGLYVILRYDQETEKIYGYKVNYRELEDIKVDGTFLGSGGALNAYYSKMRFKDGEYEIYDLAHFDSMENEYELNGKRVSKEEVEAYIRVFNNKENVKWKEYKN